MATFEKPNHRITRPEDNGGTSEGEMYWINDVFPDDIAGLLFKERDEDKDEEDDQ